MTNPNDDPDGDARVPSSLPLDSAGDRQWRWKLYIPGQVDGGGRLILVLGDARLVTVPIKGRHVRSLLALQRAAKADAHVEEMDPADRGFRTVDEIAGDYYEPDELAAAPTAGAVTHYLSQVNGLIRDATPPGAAELHLTDSVRKVGIRLRPGLTIVRRRSGNSPA